MPTRNKIALTAFFVTLITLLVAAFMYIRSQNETPPSSELVIKQGPGLNYNPSVKVIDDHPGINITLINEKGIIESLGKSGVWENGIRRSFPDSSIIYPQSLTFEITNEKQIGLNSIEDKVDEETLTVSKSLFVTSNDSGETRIVIHLNPGYLERMGEIEAEKEVVGDLLYYTYILSGNRFGMLDFKTQLDSSADDYVESNVDTSITYFDFESSNEK